MSVSNRGWNLSSEHKSEEQVATPEENAAGSSDHADRWIWGVWIAVALIAVAILPFASRFQDVALAIAAFCGIKV